MTPPGRRTTWYMRGSYARRAVAHRRGPARLTHQYESPRLRFMTKRLQVLFEDDELRELQHLYTAIGRREAIGPAWDAILGVVDVVHSIELDDVTRARRLVAAAPTLSARDAVHLAVMHRRGISRILTFATGFDSVIGIERIGA